MKNLTTCAILFLSFSSYAGPGTKILSINSKIFQKLAQHLPQSKTIMENKDATVIEVESHQVEEVSALIHKRLNRCGGFMVHKSLEEANKLLTNSKMVAIEPTAEYTINQQDIVQSMVDDIREENIRDTILKLTSFETRHYTSKGGIESSHMIKDMWQDLSKHRSDVKVEIYRHKHFPQPSVIMTLEGSEKSDEVIILGGH
jgi:leucyl aminopeptidase